MSGCALRPIQTHSAGVNRNDDDNDDHTDDDNDDDDYDDDDANHGSSDYHHYGGSDNFTIDYDANMNKREGKEKK